jgi:glycosyltransferase involved in cell wall biosynthesis
MPNESGGAAAPAPESRINGRPLRVLMLTDYFPKPTLPIMGVWALEQAQAIAAAGAEVLVVSPTSWIPPLLGRLRPARPFAQCPPEHVWPGGVTAKYPRWCFYSVGPVMRLWRNRPALAFRLGWWTLRRQLMREIERWKPDVIFAHHTVPNGMVALRLNQKLGIPFVVQDHDFGAIESCERARGRWRAYQRVASQAFAMAGVSKRMSEALERLFHPPRTTSLFMGIQPIPDELRQTPPPAELRGKIVVFSAAIFYHRKGIPLMVEAFASIAGKFPDAVLRIGGDGHERPAVEAAVAKANLGDRIQLLGSLDHQRLLQEMVWSDVFMLVGWEEPFGVVYLEAMSAGKPIICCNDCGICDVLVDYLHGIIVPPKNVKAAADAIEELLENKNLRLRMGRAASALFDERLNSWATAHTLLRLLNAAATSGLPPREIPMVLQP